MGVTNGCYQGVLPMGVTNVTNGCYQQIEGCEYDVGVVKLGTAAFV